MNRTELIEAMARALARRAISYGDSAFVIESTVEVVWRDYAPDARAVITALEAQIPGLADLIDGKAVIVPARVTLPMQHAYFSVIDENLVRVEKDVAFGRYDSSAIAYTAMIAASPYKDAKP